MSMNLNVSVTRREFLEEIAKNADHEPWSKSDITHLISTLRTVLLSKRKESLRQQSETSWRSLCDQIRTLTFDLSSRGTTGSPKTIKPGTVTGQPSLDACITSAPQYLKAGTEVKGLQKGDLVVVNGPPSLKYARVLSTVRREHTVVLQEPDGYIYAVHKSCVSTL